MLKTNFGHITQIQKDHWDRKLKEFHMHIDSPEVATAQATPICEMIDRIGKVTSRITTVGQLACETVDRLTGPRPQEVTGATKEDTPIGEYYALAETVNRLEMVTTYLEGEVDRLHTL